MMAATRVREMIERRGGENESQEGERENEGWSEMNMNFRVRVWN